MLEQKEIEHQVFLADNIMLSMIDILLHYSPIVQIYLIPLVLKAFKYDNKIIAMCGKQNLINFCALLAHSATKSCSTKIALDIIKSLQLSRDVLEQIINKFLDITDGYNKLILSYYKKGEFIIR